MPFPAADRGIGAGCQQYSGPLGGCHCLVSRQLGDTPAWAVLEAEGSWVDTGLYRLLNAVMRRPDTFGAYWIPGAMVCDWVIHVSSDCRILREKNEEIRCPSGCLSV